MGPIQSGMNQIIQNIMHGATMYAGGKAIRGVKKEVKKGTEAIEGVKQELKNTTKEWQDVVKKNPKIDKDYATAMASANISPEEANKDMNYILNTDPNNNEPPTEGFDQRMRAGETAYKSLPNDYSALPEVRLRETATQKINQRNNFEKLKKEIDLKNINDFKEAHPILYNAGFRMGGTL